MSFFLSNRTNNTDERKIVEIVSIRFSFIILGKKMRDKLTRERKTVKENIDKKELEFKNFFSFNLKTCSRVRSR
ncbi:hypothetical protein OAT67_07945 [Bacteriovoracaceae bacterium]|nr:hypothetical protein [Bacteriovoracaceae bacterium]